MLDPSLHVTLSYASFSALFLLLLVPVYFPALPVPEWSLRQSTHQNYLGTSFPKTKMPGPYMEDKGRAPYPGKRSPGHFRGEALLLFPVTPYLVTELITVPGTCKVFSGQLTRELSEGRSPTESHEQ